MRRAGARPEAEEDDPSRGLIDGEDAPPRRRWRTRTSRMSSLHEPVPTGVYVGFASCAALFLFPTKALAQDQLGSLRRLLAAHWPDLTCATLDGDTPRGARETLAASPPSVVITNPDMLHFTLLPGADGEWAKLLNDVKVVVVDEAHVYVGAFGTHVAAVLRRLARCVAFRCACAGQVLGLAVQFIA